MAVKRKWKYRRDPVDLLYQRLRKRRPARLAAKRPQGGPVAAAGELSLPGPHDGLPAPKAPRQPLNVPWAAPVTIPGITQPCPECGHDMELRTHATPARLNERLLQQKCYHTSWYFCANRDCSTKAVYDNEYLVWNNVSRKHRFETVDR